MPRIKDPIWKKFNEIQLANGSTRGECPICKATVVGLVSRLKAHVMQFLAQEPPFSKHLFDSELAKAAPVSWWKTGVRLGFPESIVNLAVAIVGGASSSGGLERHFSSLGFSYGTLRAQLGIEKAGKIAFLYRELNQ